MWVRRLDAGVLLQAAFQLFLGHHAQVEAFVVQLLLADVGEGQQIGHQGGHAVGGAQHPLHEVALFIIEAVVQALAQQLGESVDGTQRRLEVV